jgi:hypothetical protein
MPDDFWLKWSALTTAVLLPRIGVVVGLVLLLRGPATARTWAIAAVAVGGSLSIVGAMQLA